jgi:hypothetical protein
MQFTKIFFLAAAVASASAAPAAEIEARTSDIKCNKHNGKWHYGWKGAAESEKYTCATTGLIVSVEVEMAWILSKAVLT